MLAGIPAGLTHEVEQQLVGQIFQESACALKRKEMDDQ
jgi:hypothetical protein